MAEVAYPITALQTDFDGYISDIQANGTQILIPVISAQGGILLMNSYAGASPHPGFVVIGIDVQSQLDTFWSDSGEHCAYETVMQALYDTNKTPVSKPFWNAFEDMWGHDPLYTAVGSYDAIKMYAWAINETQSFNANTIVSQLEEIRAYNPIFSPYPGLPGAGGYGAFTRSHDVREGYPFGYTLFVQWHPDGTKVVVPSFGAIYPDAVATGSYLTPQWDGWAFNT